MAERKVLIFDSPQSPWHEFVDEFLEDTPSSVSHEQDSQRFLEILHRFDYDVLFVNSADLSLQHTQALKAIKASKADFLMYHLGQTPSTELGFEKSFDTILDIPAFQKTIVETLPLPANIRVLVTDDEEEIGSMIKDYLGDRQKPSFDVEYVSNGKEGLAALNKNKPDVLVLDVKMPVMDGREVYRTLKESGNDLPVIMFFDAISGNEVQELHEIGRPAILDKSGRENALPWLLSTIKKMVYFA